ncbi:MAG TPA: Trk system potassium transporter TrkA [Phycisphaerae bacterium]|nr:Trk system potassium transporter TrkA [Phycisphaerae bacterium]
MNILIAGAGEVGRHVAEMLGAKKHNIVMIDTSARKLQALEDRLDLRTLRGNCAHAEVLIEAGAGKCDLLVAATNVDEVNLLSAAIGKGLGAKKCAARVHHAAFAEQRGFDYATHLGIDQLVCPEYLTSLAIARNLRNPGALAVEQFAKGRIEMQELPVEDGAPAMRTALQELRLPPGVRLAQVHRAGKSFIPKATTVIQPGDVVTLIGERAAFEQGRKAFTSGKSRRENVVIMGGSTMGVWLCRALKGPHFSVRLFEVDRERAEELSHKLEHVTVVHGDPSDPHVHEEERIGGADAFVAVTKDDEHNILASAQAKSLGVRRALASVERSAYHHLLSVVGIDKAFSPREEAAKELRKLLEAGPLRVLGTLAEGTAEVYEIQPTRRATAVGQELRNLKLPANCLVGAIQHGDAVKVPGAEDTVRHGDTVLLIGPHGLDRELKKLFADK